MPKYDVTSAPGSKQKSCSSGLPALCQKRALMHGFNTGNKHGKLTLSEFYISLTMTSRNIQPLPDLRMVRNSLCVRIRFPYKNLQPYG